MVQEAPSLKKYVNMKCQRAARGCDGVVGNSSMEFLVGACSLGLLLKPLSFFIVHYAKLFLKLDLLEYEAIEVEHLLAEPKNDNVSVDGVLSLKKCLDIEDIPGRFECGLESHSGFLPPLPLMPKVRIVQASANHAWLEKENQKINKARTHTHARARTPSDRDMYPSIFLEDYH
ncbi:hypothetical protein CK203_044797 [Vitis vinifera]|uniref:Uncharacterized protein n=1 Tax=Vitis vinifera TaxID=29760 RepID=A0A438H746_VITVI|nr:hypothetical protein CK203_044797 [Vitis vinifera]